MRIVIDAMSGDNAPLETVKGAVEAATVFPDVKIVLTGNRRVIERVAAEQRLSLSNIEIIEAESVITMQDEPNCVVKDKKDSSMAVGLLELKNNADAFVSAGNTGALQVGSTLLIRAIKGIRRPCLASILPFPEPVMLVDCGANVNVVPEYLVTWADMASIYMRKLFGMKRPKVGLLNNGVEEHKGTEVEIETYKLLREDSAVNFIGNVEACDIPFAPCDILVTDGFTGNIVLKYSEGFGKFFFRTLKGMYSQNNRSRLSFLAMKGQIMDLKRQFDASEYGGAPLLGLSKPVIKAHGSSDAKAIRNAVKQAINFAKTGINDEIAEMTARRAAEKAAKKAAAKVSDTENKEAVK